MSEEQEVKERDEVVIVNNGNTGVCDIKVYSNQIVEVKFLERCTVTLKDLREMEKVYFDIIDRNKKYLIIVISGKGGMTSDASEYDLFGEIAFNFAKLAIVVPTFYQRMFAKWYFKYTTQPDFSYRFFGNATAAHNWLEESFK
ncbi:MAG: STAS/SEC14 domain-containing protein [Flavobacteriales bacterium]|nr:STAS/SEC14 domain-containing protein [Flavobacteriales bacterium]